jgi:hypothetical protein
MWNQSLEKEDGHNHTVIMLDTVNSHIYKMIQTYIAHTTKSIISPTSRSGVLIKNLILSQIAKKCYNLQDPNVHYNVYKSMLLVPIPSQMNPVHMLPAYRSILVLHSYLCLCFQSGLFPSSFLAKIVYTFLVSPMNATSSEHLILLT